MERSYQDAILRLKNKLQDFITLYEQTEVENMQLIEENTKLKDELHKCHQRSQELESSNERLKLAGSFSLNEEDAKDAKQKVNQMVREIDKCIALLNK